MDIQIVPFPLGLSIERIGFLKAPCMPAIAPVGRGKRFPLSQAQNPTISFKARSEFPRAEKECNAFTDNALLTSFREQQSRTFTTAR